MIVSMSFSIRKEGTFTSVSSNQILGYPVPDTTSLSAPRSIASGDYNIGFKESPWLNSTIFLSQARYICVGGTQMVSVTGYVVMASTSTPGTLQFTTPFPTYLIPVGGTSTCYSGTTVIPSICTCVEGLISLQVLLSSPVTRVDFIVNLMATTIPPVLAPI